MIELPARLDRESCAALDRKDELRAFRDRFLLPDGLVYLDGNSLGPVPSSLPARIDAVVRDEWGTRLIRSWTESGWIDAPSRVGDKIAQLVGAEPGEVLACDSTSVNLFKLLAAATRARPGRGVLLSERENFPTDLYVAAELAGLAPGGVEVRLVDRDALTQALAPDVCVLMLTQVDFRSGWVHDMEGLTGAAHRAGALALWDLSHSAGAMPVELNRCQADLAVGCGYKYLNGGPGAPAYLFVARRLQEELRSPIAGWLGHSNPFDFAESYTPAPGIQRFAAGTPPILSFAALEAAVDIWLEADLQRVREKSLALSDLFIGLVQERPELGLTLATPTDPERRGSQVALKHPEGYGIMQALIEAGVIGDFRPPDNLRFGLAPLYNRFVDVWDAVAAIGEVLRSGAHRDPRWQRRAKVT